MRFGEWHLGATTGSGSAAMWIQIALIVVAFLILVTCGARRVKGRHANQSDQPLQDETRETYVRPHSEDDYPTARLPAFEDPDQTEPMPRLVRPYLDSRKPPSPPPNDRN